MKAATQTRATMTDEDLITDALIRNAKRLRFNLEPQLVYGAQIPTPVAPLDASDADALAQLLATIDLLKRRNCDARTLRKLQRGPNI